MKRLLILLSDLAGMAVLWRIGAVTPTSGPETSATDAPTMPPTSQPPRVIPSPHSPHPLAFAFGSDATPPAREPAVLLELFQAYRRASGTFPTAEDNPALMHQLTRPDPRGHQLFPATHPRLNPEGALVDAWGTPFFFHHLSSMDLEIRSAGPDREFYTEDDLVASSQ